MSTMSTIMIRRRITKIKIKTGITTTITSKTITSKTPATITISRSKNHMNQFRNQRPNCLKKIMN